MSPTELVPPSSRGRTLLVLALLYFVEGLPFGFQASALPLRLRSEGASLETLGYLSALAMPWVLKAFWAPLVDRTKPRPFGRRKAWIVPMQLALAATCFAAATVNVRTHLPVLLGLVLAMNLFTATMDVAVDGLAVNVLQDRDLGLGNAAQVSGYKLGMIMSGGALVYFAQERGWWVLFVAMGALVLFASLVTIAFEEPRSTNIEESEGRASFSEVIRALRIALATPSTAWIVALAMTYKSGEAIADVLYRPLLVDHGISVAHVATILMTYGMVASTLGSIAGGLLAERIRLVPLLFGIAALRVLPLGLELWVATGAGGDALLIAISIAEHLIGGALTTVTFALLMSSVDPRIGATHFTVLAVLENIGKGFFGFFAGKLATSVGYVPSFALAIGLSALFLLLYVPLVRHERRGAYARSTS